MINLDRLSNESTAVFLGRVLDSINLHDMADRARSFHFDDYFCPPEIDDGANINRLVAELRYEALGASTEQKRNLRSVMEAAMEGVFDGTREEADAWSKGEDGQQTFHDLLKGLDGRQT